jgi:DNA-binding winged helix-turn-helix (wHTH) protein
MPHAEIARRVWGPNILSTSYIANLQELVKKARAALPPTDMIVTERGRGYWLALDVDPAITKQRIVPHDKLSQFCPNYHEYTPDNTKIEPDGTRSCRKCRKATTRKYRETSILRGAT